MEACSVICRKATVALPDAYSLSSRAQNRGFCAFLGFETPIFGCFEHKIEVFVLFWASRPPFSGVSSTKSRFLCAFALRDPHFRAFRAQNRGFCALFFETVGFAGRGNLFSAPAWRGNLIAARTASGVAERSCRLSSHRGKWRGVTAPPA